MRSLRMGLIYSAFLFGSAMVALAQTGSIQGTVEDSAGAVVQGAQVTVKNTASNAARTVVSSELGYYSVTNLPPANYEITVARDSFKTFRIPSVELTVDQALSVNVKLNPGATSEEIQVRGDQIPDIDLESSQVSNIVETREIKDLPLVTRDPYQLILLSPGTIQTNGNGGFSVNGARDRNNNFLIDGADNNDTSVPGIPGGLVALNPDATEEFRVITNNFLPEFGRNNGAIIDVVTKSGTNQLHGGAYWFGRYNGAGGARDYFDHNPKQNPYVRNQFGFSVGGPIIKDKTFFFVNVEWDRFRTTLTDNVIVPTKAFKTGSFTFNGVAVNLDPNAPNTNNAYGAPIDPTIQNILNSYPLPNGPAVDDIRGLFFFPSSSRQNSENLTTKFDHRFTDREVVSLHGDYNVASDPDGFHDEFLPGLGATALQQHSYNYGAALTSTITNTLINEARFGFNRNDAPFQCGNVSAINAVGQVDSFGRGRDYTFPNITGFGCSALADSNGQSRRTGTWGAADALSWVKGLHTFKAGSDFRVIYEDGFDSFGSRDTLGFSGFTDFGQPFVNLDPAHPCDPNEPNPALYAARCGTSDLQNLSSTLLGIADTENQSQFFDKSGTRTPDDNRKFRQHEYGFFIQDSWKIRPNLTLNYGARYQFNGVPYEANGNLSNLYVDPSGTGPFTFLLTGPGSGRLLYNNDFSNLEPRVGFAWDPFKNGKTSIRAAFGTFHDRVFGNLFGNARGNPPFQETNSSNPFDTPENTPLPGNLTPSAVVASNAPTGPIGPTLFDPNLRMPYSENWNFGIQREVLRNLTVDINYVGTHGVHLLRVVDGNPPDPVLVQALINDGVPPSQLQFATLYFGAEFFGLPFDAVHNNAFANPASFAGGGAALNRSIGNSNYNGLQANITKRISYGFQIQGAYTYSHAIDDAPDPIVPALNNRSFPRNSHALGNERGNSDNDIRQRLVMNYIYEFPFGRGKAHLSSGFVGKALEGWQLSGITSFQSGHPYDIFGGGVDSEHTGLTSRADLIGNPALPAGHPRTETGPPLSAFALPNPNLGLPGSVGRNRFTGPGYNNWDAVVAKTTQLGEHLRLETRAEVYNIFNRTQFDQPGNLFTDSGTFGMSTATLSRADTTTSARQMQFAMKLNF